MKILNGNTLYDFTVAQSGTVLSTDADEFQIKFRYRNFQSQSQSPDFEGERSIRFTRNQSSAQSSSLMMEALQEFDVPESRRFDMATHFSFYLDRLSRMSCNRRGSIHVLVCLDAKEFSPERAAAIRRRIESGRRESERERDVRRVAAAAAEMEMALLLPAETAVVESLERKRVAVVEEERECSICLEKLRVGTEVITLPCLHVYHTDCIIRWLERAHFCPFCRFKLPC